MRIALLLSVLIVSLVLANGAFALSVTVTQSGADSDEIMKGRTFTVEASGWSGSCSQATISFSECPSCSLSGESAQKTIGSASSVSWTTTSASQSATAQTVSVSVSSGCTLQQASSSSFNTVLPPSLSLTATPSVSSLTAGGSYTVNVDVSNGGETTANDVSFSVSGTGMSISSGCSSISSLDEGQSAGQSCTITAAAAGTPTVTLTASSTNADAASNSFSMTVNSAGGTNPPGGGSPGGGSGPGGSGGSEGENATKTGSISPGTSLSSQTALRTRLKEMLGYDFDTEAFVNNSVQISGDVTLEKDFVSTSSGSTLTLTYKYRNAKKAKDLVIYLKIPKDFASHADNITVSAPGARTGIVNGDPEYLFIYPEIAPSQQFSITLTTASAAGSDVLDDVLAEVYAESLETVESPEEMLCTPGTSRCYSGNVQKCSADNVWETIEVCEYGCRNDQCMEKPPGGIADILPIGEFPLMIITGVVIVIIVAVVLVVVFQKRKKKPSFGKLPSMGGSPLGQISK